MKTSTEINSFGSIVGEEKAVEFVAKAGFDAWDFSMFRMCRYDKATKSLLENDHPLAGRDYIKFARRLKQIGLDNGIECNQSHAPYPPFCKEVRDYFKRAIECTAEAGGKICVIHPCHDWSPEENAKMYNNLLPFAKDHGVKIATENMWNWDSEKEKALFAACATSESFNAHLDAVNDDYLVACLDIGHAEMMGEEVNTVDLVYALGDRLKALHIHDNDKIHDLHEIPFSDKVKFEPIVKALQDINYDGYFTLECPGHFTNWQGGDVFEGVKELYGAVRKLADMFEGNI